MLGIGTVSIDLDSAMILHDAKNEGRSGKDNATKRDDESKMKLSNRIPHR